MSSRDNILVKLRAARSSILNDVAPRVERRPMTLVDAASPTALRSRFLQEAESLGCMVTHLHDPDEAIKRVLELIAPDQLIQSWDLAHIPLNGLADALHGAGIRVAPDDTTVRIGLTGVDAALAGTGSLVLASGAGKTRQPSLLPPVHIAVVRSEQIVPNLDTWIAAHRADEFQQFQAASNIVVISGPSRTGDIANIPVKGVHGPGEVHVILIENSTKF